MPSASDSAPSLERLCGELTEREKRFLAHIGVRLIAGRTYGDPTAHPVGHSLTEILDEIADQVGWLFPAYERVKFLAQEASKR